MKAFTNQPSRGNPHRLNMNADPVAVSVTEAAALAGVSRSMLYAEMAAGRLAFAKVGKRRLIPVEALLAWLQAATTEIQ